MCNLSKIQKLSKLGKVLCKIVFIFCMIGIFSSIVGIAVLAIGMEDIRLGTFTIKSLIKYDARAGIDTAKIYMAVALILCSGEAVIAKFSEHYFKGELQDGTPFNMERAKELTRLGIITISVSIGTEIIAGIIYEIMSFIFGNAGSLDVGNGGSVSVGIAFIIISLICRYGAEIGEETIKAK